jgi:hypothetical protein
MLGCLSCPQPAGVYNKYIALFKLLSKHQMSQLSWTGADADVRRYHIMEADDSYGQFRIRSTGAGEGCLRPTSYLQPLNLLQLDV